MTKANAWRSYHQYGLAVDMVLRIDGKWSWETGGQRDAQWKQLHDIAEKHGLEPLSWELPHLQLRGHTGSSLLGGNYPAFGDEAWAENLAAAIAGWSGGGAPPPPTVAERPPLADQGGDSADPILGVSDPTPGTELNRPATPPVDNVMNGNAKFETIQAMIDKWEGGYVDHPSDPGGATNMGITQKTLARWRGAPVTKEDVRQLTRDEQRKIMRAYYYDVIAGDSLPGPVAAVTHNAAILHGPNRAARFLQTVARKYVPTLGVDGAIGPITIGAVASLPARNLVSDFIATELEFLKGLPHWSTFGKGWTNRLTDIKAFAEKLDSTGTYSQDTLEDATRGPGAISEAGTSAGAGGAPQPGAPGVLGVDNMLGETVGKALLGKKTTIGGIGTLLAVLAPTLGSAVGLDASTIDSLHDTVLPVAQTLLGWGVLGKLDRWIAAIRM